MLVTSLHPNLSPTFSGLWASPQANGTAPPPCRGFSLTKVDDPHAVLFGGEQRVATSTGSERTFRHEYFLTYYRKIWVELMWTFESKRLFAQLT